MSEPQNLLSASPHKHEKYGSNRTTVALACPKHGFVRGDHCPKCADEAPKNTVNIKTDEWVKGYWEHLGPQPVYIESKKHLFAECEKRGVMPRAFMKPKSQGRGFEIAKGR